MRPQAATLVAACFAADPRLVKVQYRMEVIDASGLPSGAITPAAELPLPSGDLRRAELVFPFDLVWAATSGNAFRTETLRRIMPIPERDFGPCPDWYLVHLAALLGPVLSLRDVAASYRVHGANHYAPRTAELDLEHVRQSVVYAATTVPAIEQLAAELGLELPYARILSVSALANRLVSHKLAPAAAPVRGRPELAPRARRRARREPALRRGSPLKLLYVAWFAVDGGGATPARAPARRAAPSPATAGAAEPGFCGASTATAGSPDAGAGPETAAKLRRP